MTEEQVKQSLSEFMLPGGESDPKHIPVSCYDKWHNGFAHFGRYLKKEVQDNAAYGGSVVDGHLVDPG